MRQAVLGELGLEAGAGRARLDARRARDRVDLEHAVEPAQVHGDDAGVAGPRDRVDAADDARAAAERHHGDVVLAAPVEHRTAARPPSRGKATPSGGWGNSPRIPRTTSR